MAKQIDILCSEVALYNAWNIVKEKGATGGIDDFFDSIDHFLLRRKLVATGTEEEIVRLIMLCMQMGKVKQKNREWIDTMLGTPQGAVLSPLMANLYMHSFDQFAISRNVPYIRYADDFLFLCESKEQAEKLLQETEQSDFASRKNQNQQTESNDRNKKLIQQRKKEFRKLAAETSGLLVDRPGTFIGITSRGVSISEKGKVIAYHHADNLSHVVVTGKGVSLSSNFISYCMERKIPIDFFDHLGKHIGSIMTPKYIQSTLWAKQSAASPSLKNSISLGIIEGKVKNQHALLKYFNKYHKNHAPGLKQKMEMMEQCCDDFKQWKRKATLNEDDFIQKLMGQEAQVAIRYWDCIRELIADDDVEFEHREHQGAQDLTNSMLNYGYAILYARIWQALLSARLNPFESLIHARQEGKPTLVYDMVAM
jgi:CRISPR-associated endonuclease Cas1